MKNKNKSAEITFFLIFVPHRIEFKLHFVVFILLDDDTFRMLVELFCSFDH